MAEYAFSTPPVARAKSSRRGAMLATAELLAVSGGLDAAGDAVGGPDAGLIAACARLVAGIEEIERLGVHRHGGTARVRMRSAALTLAVQRLSDAVADMDATTSAGLRAKARATLPHARYAAEWDADGEEHPENLGWSLARDLLRGA